MHVCQFNSKDEKALNCGTKNNMKKSHQFNSHKIIRRLELCNYISFTIGVHCCSFNNY